MRNFTAQQGKALTEVKLEGRKNEHENGNAGHERNANLEGSNDANGHGLEEALNRLALYLSCFG